jgi:pyruvate/2-oxoglutarate/acetoin dehydrogenase E1 component
MSTLVDRAWQPLEATVQLTYPEAINLAMRDAMSDDSRVMVMGEDLTADGGVFKTNAGLVELFGPERVLNTPICENGFLDAALGMSLVGMRPVVERAIEAARALAAVGIEAEIVDLQWLRPLDLETIMRSIARTGQLLIVEEQVHAAGWGATVISEVAIRGAEMRPPHRVSLPDDTPIPYCPALEDEAVPSADRIVQAALELVRP